jgi:peptide/nickel transport system substrate-binding protein
MCLVLSVFVLFWGLASCSIDDEGRYPRKETLYIGGLQWGTPTTFNPLAWWSAFPIMSGGNNTVTYEPVLKYNTLTFEIEPLLGTLFEKNTDSISVLVNPAAAWSDGTPLTAEDIKYTYYIGDEHSVLYSGIWEHLSDIRIDTVNMDTVDVSAREDIFKPSTLSQYSGSYERVTFVMEGARQVNPLAVLTWLQSIKIIPKHFFAQKFKELDEDFEALRSLSLDKNPIISGPYQIHTYTNERIILKRRDDYWGNDALYDGEKPQPKFILHPILENNSHFNFALQRGQLDVNTNYMPRVWDRKEHGVRAWYDDYPYYKAGSIPTMVFNTEHDILSNKDMRRAIASAINYEDVRDLAVSGYSEDLRPGMIIPFLENEKSYFSEEDAEQYGTTYDPEQAKEYLQKAGYTPVWRRDGRLSHMENAQGEQVEYLRIMCPSGWTDWEAMVRIIVRDLRNVGIDAYQEFVDGGVYWESLPYGSFDMILHTPAPELTPLTPLSRFEGLMSSRYWDEIGQRMDENYGRYNNPDSDTYNPAVDSLLNAIPLINNSDSLAEAYRKLNKIFMIDQPAVPLIYRPQQYYQFNETVWENFPHANNPVGPQQMPTVGAARDVLWELRPVGKGE